MIRKMWEPKDCPAVTISSEAFRRHQGQLVLARHKSWCSVGHGAYEYRVDYLPVGGTGAVIGERSREGEQL